MPPPADLLYTSDAEPGITRRRSGKGFAYRAPDGSPVADKTTLKRIRGLVIPPAWTDVWISPDPGGHIQATGRDARGRKQYVYHPDWRSWREETKFLHILEFAAALPRLRERVARDLGERKLSRTLVLATAVRVLDQTLIRVGNDEYAQQNASYGLTTLEWQHVEASGSRVRFRFRGKSGKAFDTTLADRRVAAVLRRLEGLPGQHLFQYVDEDGAVHRIGSEDVNAYIREATGGDFSAKDFRTWAATVLAASACLACEPAASETALKRNLARCVKQVAGRLGNTPAVCRASYIHPEVLAAYLDGTLARLAARLEGGEDERDPAGLFARETAVLRFLRRRVREKERQAPAPEPPLAEALHGSLAA